VKSCAFDRKLSDGVATNAAAVVPGETAADRSADCMAEVERRAPDRVKALTKGLVAGTAGNEANPR
jgi:hypothetical protein